jgi:hypothetical protein
VGLILDLAVVALALVVIGSLALLAWTLAVSAVRAVHRGRADIAESRRSVADADARLRASATRASSIVEDLVRRTTPATRSSTATDEDGEQSDA